MDNVCIMERNKDVEQKKLQEPVSKHERDCHLRANFIKEPNMKSLLEDHLKVHHSPAHSRNHETSVKNLSQPNALAYFDLIIDHLHGQNLKIKTIGDSDTQH